MKEKVHSRTPAPPGSWITKRELEAPGGGKGWGLHERGQMNRAEMRVEVIALRCTAVVSTEMELTSSLSHRKRKRSFLGPPQDEKPVIKFTMVR